MSQILLFITFYLACAQFGLRHLTAGATGRNPTLMISLDGFRADKLDEFLANNPNSNLQTQFVDVGAKAEYMMPSFPSLTFPNHFTIVTGIKSIIEYNSKAYTAVFFLLL